MTIEDKQAITELVHRYADAVCRRDEEQWASCWADDASWSLGMGRDPEGRDAIVELWRTAMSGFSHAIQMVNNGSVEVDGDTATGRWYIDEHLRRTDGTASRFLAWYDDTYVRTSGGWQFSRRAVQGLYAGAADLSAGFVDLE